MRLCLKGLLEVIYPLRARCVGCGDRSGQEREWLCEKCRAELAARWYGAGRPPAGGWVNESACAYFYQGPAIMAVRTLKYRGVRRLAEGMGKAMADAARTLSPLDVDGVVPVPMHKKRLRKRGFNHARALAEQVAGRLDLPVIDALERVRNTPQQARLTDEERLTNLIGAFAVTGDVKGRRLLLIDDVRTTGATANACAEALKRAGADYVALICYASARDERMPGKGDPRAKKRG